jgi:hypothetical protein
MNSNSFVTPPSGAFGATSPARRGGKQTAATGFSSPVHGGGASREAQGRGGMP